MATGRSRPAREHGAMRAYWYFVSSLPMVQFGEKPPMDAEAFGTACAQMLPEEERVAIEAVLEGREPPRGAATGWWDEEVQLRNATARIRAKARGMDPSGAVRPHGGFRVQIETLVADAYTRGTPLEREQALDRIRWMLAEERAQHARFGFPALLAYAVQVRIAQRWAALEEEGGRVRVDEYVAAAFETDEQEQGADNEP